MSAPMQTRRGVLLALTAAALSACLPRRRTDSAAGELESLLFFGAAG